MFGDLVVFVGVVYDFGDQVVFVGDVSVFRDLVSFAVDDGAVSSERVVFLNLIVFLGVSELLSVVGLLLLLHSASICSRFL